MTQDFAARTQWKTPKGCDNECIYYIEKARKGEGNGKLIL